MQGELNIFSKYNKLYVQYFNTVFALFLSFTTSDFS